MLWQALDAPVHTNEAFTQLSKHLMTRLQYANFKVEHGWVSINVLHLV